MARENIMHLTLDEVVVRDERRAVDREAVKKLAASIKSIGLQHPITVRSKGGEFILIAGRHRLEAVRHNGDDRIQAVISKMDDVDSEMWEISENLHRSDLSALQRSEQIDRWRELKAEKVRQAGAPLGGQQPKEQGFRKTADDLGVSEQEVRRAKNVANLSDEAKAAVVEAGLDDNQSALLTIAKAEPARQASVVREIAEHKASRIDGDIAHRAAVSVAEWIVEHADGNDLDAIKANLFATTSKAIAIELTNLLGQSIMDRRYA